MTPNILIQDYEKALQMLEDAKPNVSKFEIQVFETAFELIWKDFDQLMRQKALFLVNTPKKDLLEISEKEAAQIVKSKRRIEKELKVMDAVKTAITELKEKYISSNIEMSDFLQVQLYLAMKEVNEARKNAITLYNVLMKSYEMEAYWIDTLMNVITENQQLRQQLNKLKQI